MYTREQVMVRLTQHQVLRAEKPGKCLWPEEKLGIEEVSRRLLLEHVLWQESERNMVERMCPTETSHKPSQRADPEPYRWPAGLSES